MFTLTLLLSAAFAANPEAQFAQRFGTGGAELSGYRLTQPRYGEARTGDAVMVWVTEPFSRSKTVKLDDPAKTPKDVVPVFKLNLIKHFQTGVYDYALMTSVFSPIVDDAAKNADRVPMKVAFSSQEWCGTVFHQLSRTATGYDDVWLSYFESEGDHRGSVALPEGALLADELFLRARELIGKLPDGQWPLLPSLEAVRLSHVPFVVGTVTVKRAAAVEKTKVPMGTFETERFDFELRWGPGGNQLQRRSVWVEKALPRRIIAWEADVASFKANEPVRERAELTGSIRDEYWKHSSVKDEGLRKKLGLLN